MSSAQGFARGVGLAQRNEALRQAQERTQLSLQREQRIAQAQARQNQLQAQHRLMQMVQDENFSGVNFMTAAEIFGVEPQAAKQIIEVGKIITATKDARARQTQAAEAARGFQLEAATNLFSGQLTPEEQAGAVSRIGVQQQQLEQNPLVGPEAAALGLQRRLAGGETQAVTAQVERRTKRQEADITRRREFQDFVDREAFLDKRGRTLVERLINQGEISPGVPLPESTKVALRQALLVEELLEDGLQATQLELSAAERKDALDQTSLKLADRALEGILQLGRQDPNLFGIAGIFRGGISRAVQATASLTSVFGVDPAVLQSVNTFTNSTLFDIANTKDPRIDPILRQQAMGFFIKPEKLGTLEAFQFAALLALARTRAGTGRVSIGLVNLIQEQVGLTYSDPREDLARIGTMQQFLRGEIAANEGRMSLTGLDALNPVISGAIRQIPIPGQQDPASLGLQAGDALQIRPDEMEEIRKELRRGLR
jgi:hypothetical protein